MTNTTNKFFVISLAKMNLLLLTFNISISIYDKNFIYKPLIVHEYLNFRYVKLIDGECLSI